MVGSMGRVGAARDNAAMEPFFSLLQKNVLSRRAWTSREELRIAIVILIEVTYHRRRRQDALRRLAPVENELIMTTRADLAGATAIGPSRRGLVKEVRLRRSGGSPGPCVDAPVRQGHRARAPRRFTLAKLIDMEAGGDDCSVVVLHRAVDQVTVVPNHSRSRGPRTK
jgi:hypothetical protein